MRGNTMGVAAAMVASAGLGLAGLGLANTAEAQPGFAPAPTYHWCPGDDWHPEWDFNWDWALCHDDHHRDVDADNHTYDWWGPPPPGVNPAPWYPPPSWAPPLWWKP
ncbi:MAG: hypothetical protein JWR32_3376 [Mycobacterium sp.]|jgi:hypothetical protein|nr:hypothetical protein [Mycobacterium sp.]